jgi:hypothetical protein
MMANFADYELDRIARDTRGVYGLAEGLIPEIARVTGFSPDYRFPTEGDLRGLIGHVAPNKLLATNVDQTTSVIEHPDPEALAADWAERSGALEPMERSFADPNVAVPEVVNVALVAGGVARFICRRANSLGRYVNRRDRTVERAVFAFGSREMDDQEHEDVIGLRRMLHRQPTEADFGKHIIVPELHQATGVDAQLLAVHSSIGDEVMRAAIDAHPVLVTGRTLVVGNAPSVVQTAGQFRRAARLSRGPNYDANGGQVTMLADGIPVARNGEGPETHQNPITFVGQVARLALALHLEEQGR